MTEFKYEINLPEDTIVDLSQPGIIHYIYPSGKEVPDNMMDPNIGGYFGKPKDNIYDEDVEYDPYIKEEIWGKDS